MWQVGLFVCSFVFTLAHFLLNIIFLASVQVVGRLAVCLLVFSLHFIFDIICSGGG